MSVPQEVHTTARQNLEQLANVTANELVHIFASIGEHLGQATPVDSRKKGLQVSYGLACKKLLFLLLCLELLIVIDYFNIISKQSGITSIYCTRVLSSGLAVNKYNVQLSILW